MHLLNLTICYTSQGPNLLWHLQNGVLEPLNPKYWLVVVGSNDLFVANCTDRFVFANILNVLQYLHMHRPKAQFLVHGILPRKDSGKKDPYSLGNYWKRGQAINVQLRNFCSNHVNLHYIQAGPLFTEETESRGRRRISPKFMKDGIHPTVEGLEVWGDYILKVLAGNTTKLIP